MPEFVSGLFYNEPSEKAPDFILANISVAPEKFIGWLMAQTANEKGYIKMVVKKSKQGKAYIELDTWEPKKKFMTEHQNDNQTDSISDDFFEGK